MSGLNDINDIPKAWRSALASLQLLFPDAVIAGGALRDREHGVKVKDLDVFISTTTPGDYGLGSLISRLQNDGWLDVQPNCDESYNNAERGIVAVIDLKYAGCPPIQLIAMKQFRLEEIDFGICQIMFDGKTIVRTREYHLDNAEQQFRLIPKVDDAMFIRSIGRWGRIKEKYPEWKFHLGSRAETHPFVPPAPKTVHINIPSVTSVQQAMRVHRLDRYAHGGWIPKRRPGDYVVTKEMADRLLTETTARLVKADPRSSTVTVHIDDRAAVASAKIISEMLEKRRELNADMALKLAARR